MSDRRTILITSIWLANLSGSEVVVRDLALGLLRRGHRPIVYSPTLGPVAAGLVKRGVAVIDDLRALGEAPDIIHANHSIPCGEALIRFPEVPAINVCHAFRFWMESPVHFPQVGAYVAVDETCRDRLVHMEGIDPDRVLILQNAVDLDRIPPRPAALNRRPQRALAFGKAASVPQLQSACEQLGIQFDSIGNAAGRMSTVPEQELIQYDLVFASARCALEALCCGCAVIVCDARGFAGLVTSRNFESLRRMNFGLRALSEPFTAERIVQEIRRYDPDDAQKVSQLARADADLSKLLDKFEKLYDEVLTGARRPSVTADARERAVAKFMHENLPRRPSDPRWPWRSEREKWKREADHSAELLRERTKIIKSLEDKVKIHESHLDASQSDLAKTAGERDDARHDLEKALSQLVQLKQSRLMKVDRLLRRIVRLPPRY